MGEQHNANRNVAPEDITYQEGLGFQSRSKELNHRLGRWREIFFDLVRLDSESGTDMTKVLEYIKSFFEKLGGQVDLIGEIKTGPLLIKIQGVGDPIGLCGHADTVKPGKGIKPLMDGITARSDGTTILGADNKHALACAMVVTEELVDSGENHRPIVIGITTNEETDGDQASRLSFDGARMVLIIDHAGPVGVVVKGALGYARADGNIPGLSGERALAFIGRFASRIGDHLVPIASPREKLNDETILPEGVNFSLGSISVGVDNSRNTVPPDGVISGKLSNNTDGNMEDIFTKLRERFESIGGQVEFTPNGASTGEVNIVVSFTGQAGHAKLDQGTKTVLPDIAWAARLLRRGQRVQDESGTTNGEVRINVSDVMWRGNDSHMALRLEARYLKRAEVRKMLGHLQALFTEFGGELSIVYENPSYNLGHNHRILRRLRRIYRQNGIEPVDVALARGMSDANDPNRRYQINRRNIFKLLLNRFFNTLGPVFVVGSGGETDTHSTRESVDAYSATKTMNVIHDWVTKK